VVIGTKTGDLELYHIPSSTLIEKITNAHNGPIYSMAMSYDKKGICTGSGDKTVKFWDFEFRQVDNEQRQLTLVHSRTLEMDDDVLCVRYSPDQRLLAVSLLDSTVKIFYVDSLKFFLSLYGHKLPVLSMDIASDSSLLVTCSADKNVKIWGMDFGDCHKSIFAHDEAITDIKFTWGTHYFWTISKDKTIKCWDADKFENIMKLEGHCDEVQALAVGHYGQFIVTASKDRSIRMWEKTEEQLFVEEERERELEARDEASMVQAMDQTAHPRSEVTEEVDAAGKQTMQTLKAGERIMEAVQVYETEAPLQAAYKEVSFFLVVLFVLHTYLIF
jgi:U3 small nucleolar RNA-associated protein 12